MDLFGRRKIYTSVEELNIDNIIVELNQALSYHSLNMNEESYLHRYRRGVQPILYRQKEIRPEINNRIVINNAAQVVNFKNGYFLTKPATYVSRREDEQVTDKVKQLNEYLYTCGKHEADDTLVNDFHTVGLGVLFVEPNKNPLTRKEKPANIYALNPRSAFVVYSRRPGNEPVYGVNIVMEDDTVYADVFTKTQVFKCYGSMQTHNDISIWGAPCSVAVQTVDPVVLPNVIGEIPIVEYTYDENRMAAFENAISIMDAINTAESNRLDGIEQTIQSLTVTWNCQFDEGVTANTIRQFGMINLVSNGETKQDLKILNESLDQAQTQVTIDNLYEQLCDKCAMPFISKNSGGTSDNGGAVYLRNGFQQADTAAMNTECLFKKSNRYFDIIFLKILKQSGLLDIGINDFELKIERNTSSNLLVKTQAAMNMKQLGLAPQIALERSGLSNDPLKDIEISKEYIFKAWDNSTATPMSADDITTEPSGEISEVEEFEA